MKQWRLRAVFMRGGTSKALMFRREDLPRDRAEWDPIFLRALGSPDPYGRQLDGMGGGISSLSKVCVVGPSERDDADVDYTFAQVPVGEGEVDYSGNCGNMSSAVGPFAVAEGIVPAPSDGPALVRIHNTNTGKIIYSRFRMADGEAAVDGDLAMSGVAGTGAPIALEFREPGGAATGRLLPTGRSLDRLSIPGLGEIDASMVDAGNPCVFVRAADLGKTGFETPDQLEADPRFMQSMEAIRTAASVAMGITPDATRAAAKASVPKVAIVAAPPAASAPAGATAGDDYDLAVRMLSMGRPHRAVPITGAVCLAAAMRIPGSLPASMVPTGQASMRIGHPSGVTVTTAAVTEPEPGSVHVEAAGVLRTARRLFEGSVLIPAQ